MSKITITEVDQTTTGLIEFQTTDIVYVPGFSLASDAVVGVPVLCSNVSEFEAHFGATAPTFAASQLFLDNFSSNAYSVSNNEMFAAGTADPSYVYAKELLNRGIPVLYERVNNGTEDITVNQMYTYLSTRFDANVTYSAAMERSESITAVTITNAGTLYRALGGTSGIFKFTEAEILNTTYVSSNTALGVVINTAAYQGVIGTVGSSVFTYDSANSTWTLNSNAVQMSTYGITVTGTPSNGDTITVTNATAITWTSGNLALGINDYSTETTSDSTIYTFTNYGFNITATTASLTEGDYFQFELLAEDCDLLDRGLYSFKYLTSGGYPVFEFDNNGIAKDMISICQTRGDAVALIDHTDYESRSLTGTTSVYYVINNSADYKLTSEYAAMFTPYVDMYLTLGYTDSNSNALEGHMALPASFAYLACLAYSNKTNANWVAIAGATRGKIPNLVQVRTIKALTNAIADSYNTDKMIAINPITMIKPYGQCIWGNRTLLDNSIKQGTTALSFLNIRNLLSDIKKQLFVACQSLIFDQNTDVLWVKFLSLITPLLDRMKSGYGIDNYKIIKLPSSTKTQVDVEIRIYPIYAVEAFSITIYLNDSGAYIEE